MAFVVAPLVGLDRPNGTTKASLIHGQFLAKVLVHTLQTRTPGSPNFAPSAPFAFASFAPFAPFAFASFAQLRAVRDPNARRSRHSPNFAPSAIQTPGVRVIRPTSRRPRSKRPARPASRHSPNFAPSAIQTPGAPNFAPGSPIPASFAIQTRNLVPLAYCSNSPPKPIIELQRTVSEAWYETSN